MLLPKAFSFFWPFPSLLANLFYSLMVAHESFLALRFPWNIFLALMKLYKPIMPAFYFQGRNAAPALSSPMLCTRLAQNHHTPGPYYWNPCWGLWGVSWTPLCPAAHWRAAVQVRDCYLIGFHERMEHLICDRPFPRVSYCPRQNAAFTLAFSQNIWDCSCTFKFLACLLAVLLLPYLTSASLAWTDWPPFTTTTWEAVILPPKYHGILDFKGLCRMIALPALLAKLKTIGLWFMTSLS